MKQYYVDMHIHIGRTHTGKTVKITGAKTLTFSNIIEHARDEKGLNMIGIIDCHSPEVLSEMVSLIESGEMVELHQGGVAYGNLTIILGSELEVYDENSKGPIHVLCFLPSLTVMTQFSQWLSEHLKNIHLSSQRVYVKGLELQKKVKQLGGLFIPAHVFTPFKSLYGRGVERTLKEVFDPTQIDAIELGLSANTVMADQLAELHPFPFLSNSDAHSLGKIAREYQIVEMEEPSFKEFSLALKGVGLRGIVANYGLDPYLGKYHETVCAKCGDAWRTEDVRCMKCGFGKKVKGVAERILELKSTDEQQKQRPPYFHQVPLDFIPGLGPKLLQKLLSHFGTEMAILHEVPIEALKEVVPNRIAEQIALARNGKLHLHAGGGGRYGKVSK